MTASPNKLNTPYQSPTPGELPIAAYQIIRAGTYLNCNVPTLSDLKKAKECGFNIGIYEGSIVTDISRPNSTTPIPQWQLYMQLALRYASEVGMKLICQSPVLSYDSSRNNQGWPLSIVNLFKDNSAMAGWLVIDEPKYDQLFVSANPNGTILKRNYEDILRNDPDSLVYFNLAFDYAKTWIGPYDPEKIEKTVKYAEYLKEYDSLLKPCLFSYDFYPIYYHAKRVNGIWEEIGDIVLEAELFYTALDLYSKESRNVNRPFWSTCMCSYHRINDHILPAPTIGHLRYEAFNALAHGAQGLAFYRFHSPYYGLELSPAERAHCNSRIKTTGIKRSVIGPVQPELPTYGKYCVESRSEGMENYESPVSGDGKITQIWYTVRDVISEIKKYEQIFLNCIVYVYGHVGVSYGKLNIIRNTIAFVLKFQFTSSSKITDGAFVSHIFNNGKNYLVIVSHNPFSSQKIFIYPREGAVYKEITPSVEPPVSLDDPEGSSSSIRRLLEPGGYIIFEW